MKENKLTKRLYKLSIGESVSIKKKDGTPEGTFIRVPSGWIYRYISRYGTTSCFIPYTEDIKYWDMELEVKRCPFCKSTDVIVMEHNKNIWYVYCNSCMAKSSSRYDKLDAIKSWNSLL